MCVGKIKTLSLSFLQINRFRCHWASVIIDYGSRHSNFKRQFSSVNIKKTCQITINVHVTLFFWRIFCFVYKSIGSDVIELLSSLIMDPDIETASMYDSRTRFLLSGPPPPGLVAIPGPRGPLPMLSTEDRVLLEPWFRRATTPFWRPEKTAKN